MYKQFLKIVDKCLSFVVHRYIHFDDSNGLEISIDICLVSALLDHSVAINSAYRNQERGTYQSLSGNLSNIFLIQTFKHKQ